MKKRVLIGVLFLSTLLICGCEEPNDSSDEMAVSNVTVEGSYNEQALITIEDEPVPVSDEIIMSSETELDD